MKSSKRIEDGFVIETVTQLVCQNKGCGRIEKRCKCEFKELEEVTSEYKRSLADEQSHMNAAPAPMSKEDSLKLYRQKIASKTAKEERAKETIRIAGMTDEELMEENNKKSSQKEMNDVIDERNKEALKNVDEIRALKKELVNSGKNKIEVKEAVKALEAEQKNRTASPTRGRPRAGSVKNPVKDPVTGEFVSDPEQE